MRAVEPPFKIDYQGNKVLVAEAEIKGWRVFYIQLPKPQKVLTITVATDNRDKKFWTSVPEGRQQEAEDVGKLIAAYIRSKKQ